MPQTFEIDMLPKTRIPMLIAAEPYLPAVRVLLEEHAYEPTAFGAMFGAIPGFKHLPNPLIMNTVILELMRHLEQMPGMVDYAAVWLTPLVQRWYTQMGTAMVLGTRGDPAQLREGLVMVRLVFTEAWTYARFLAEGVHTYHVSKGLMQRLINTELKNITTAEFQLPYKAIQLRFPKGSLAAIRKPGTEKFTCIDESEGVVLMDEVVSVNDSGVRAGTRRLSMTLESGEPGDIANDKSSHSDIVLSEETIDDSIKTSDELFLKSHGADQASKLWFTPYFKCFMNVVMYITSAATREELEPQEPPAYRQKRSQMHKHAKGSKKYERCRAELQALESERIILLGGHLPELGNGDHLGIPVTKRTLAQGHWKMQFHGPNRSLRKRIFIQPYWRGPELGTLADATLHKVNG